MKKLIVSTAAVILAVIPMFAQGSIFNNPNNKSYFGIRASGEITCPGKISSYGLDFKAFKNGGGFEIGGIYNVPLVANFYIEPGLKFYYNTYSLDNSIIVAASEYTPFDGLSFRKMGLRIPVMLGYHFDFTDNVKVSVFTGPELETGLSAKAHKKGGLYEIDESLYGDDGGMKRIDLNWGIGAGITYKHVYFGVSGGIGLLNMINDSDETFHENRVSFSVGYNF